MVDKTGQVLLKRLLRVNADQKNVKRAVDVLTMLGGKAIKTVADELRQCPDWRIRRSAVAVFRKLRPVTIETLEYLVDAASDVDATVRQEARAALAKTGAIAIPRLVATLKRTDREITKYHTRMESAEGVRSSVDVDAMLKARGERDRALGIVRALSMLGLGTRMIEAVPSLLKGNRSIRKVDPAHYDLRHAIAAVGAGALPAIAQSLKDVDASTRMAAIESVLDLGLYDAKTSRLISSIATSDPDRQVRSMALDSLKFFVNSAMDIIENVVLSTSTIKQDVAQPQFYVRSELLRESLRQRAEKLIENRHPVKLTSILAKDTKRAKKRVTAESEKSLLALIDTCLAWNEATVSERRLRDSDFLKEKRRVFGLDESVSTASIHNYLTFLAKLCNLPSILKLHANKQSSSFRPQARERLVGVRKETERILHQLVQSESQSP